MFQTDFFTKTLLRGRKFILRKKCKADEMNFFIVTYHNFIMR